MQDVDPDNWCCQRRWRELSERAAERFALSGSRSSARRLLSLSLQLPPELSTVVFVLALCTPTHVSHTWLHLTTALSALSAPAF
jgi:hypothetical protein